MTWLCMGVRLQALRWTFEAAPGHPALGKICEHMKAHATKAVVRGEH